MSNGTPKQAMDFLVKENGFIKFDTLLKAANLTVEDSGMLAVYDLILASMSMNFATCSFQGSFGCSKQSLNICKKCKSALFYKFKLFILYSFSCLF